jgi:DNA-directed RNA polymerase-3 subunit RPC5
MVDVDQEQRDPDPIKSSYDVYIRPGISGERQIYVLQFPNRDAKQHYTEENQSKPISLRIKPEAGMAEIDVPVDVWRNYDREKGIKWGEAKSNMTKSGGSHGMPGGFGIGGAQPSGRGRGRGEMDDEINQESLLEDYAGAVQRGQVLKKQTLGGQFVSKDETNPQYMIGVWRNSEFLSLSIPIIANMVYLDQLHLTPADQIVPMRPQFHHIDAQAELEHHLRVRDPNTAARSHEARAVHMTVKSSIDGEEDTGENMTEKLIAVQQESWTHHRYIDEDSADAWEIYHENLFVSDEVIQMQGPVGQTQHLSSGFEDEDLLDTISVTRDAAKLSRKKACNAEKEKAKGKGKEKGKEGTADGDESDSSTMEAPSPEFES